MERGRVPVETVEKLIASLVQEAVSTPPAPGGEGTEKRLRDKMDELLDAEEDYRSWTANAPYLYSYLFSKILEWPSLAVEWLPGMLSVNELPFQKHQVIIGTHTSGGAQNYLMVLDVLVPNADKFPVEDKRYRRHQDGTESMSFAGYSDDLTIDKVRVAARIPHPGEANSVRHMPQKANFIATIGTSGDVLIFDCADARVSNSTGELQKFSTAEGTPAQQVCDGTGPVPYRMKGLEGEGWGLAWCTHPAHEGYLAAVAECGSLVVWNWEAGPGGAVSDVLHRFDKTHKAPQDVAWSSLVSSEVLLGTVGDDGFLALWDLRQPSAVAKVAASPEAVNSLCFSQSIPHLLCTGGVDKDLRLFDTRKLSSCLHRMSGHEKAVNRVTFSPVNVDIVASCGDDKRANIWDISRIGMEQSDVDAQDGPPELVFGHSGHSESVTDISWNSNDDSGWLLATVGEDNRFQIWQPSEVCISGSDKQDPLKEDMSACIE